MKTKTPLSIALLIILIAWLIYYLRQNMSDFAQLKIVNPLFLVIIIIIFIINYFLIAFVNKELLKPLGVYLKNFEAFSLAIVTGFYNLITPFRGGAGVRAVYLKKKHGFAYVHFLATLSAIYVLVFLVASFLGIISTLIIYNQTGIFSLLLFLVFSSIFLGLLFIAIVSPKLPETKNKWINRFIKVINGWHLIKKNYKVIFITSFITLIQILLGSLMLWLQFQVFGTNISFVACVFLSAIGNLSLLISITPGNLGISEAVIVFSASTIGITPAQSLSAALLGRAISFLVLFILGPIFSYILLKHKPNKNETENETNIKK